MSATLWTGKEIQAHTAGAGFTQWVVGGISIDSRTLQAGDLFIALQGPHFDGHHFVEEAFRKGAGAALVNKTFNTADAWWSKRVIYVNNTQAAFLQLARRARARCKGKVLAITGSAGKTCVKTGITHALSFQRSVFSSYKNF